MTDLVSPSPEVLASRRRALRQQRRLRHLQRLWRFIAVAGMATGSLWALRHPHWLLHSSDQITVSGNRMLSDTTIQSLVPLEYPQSLLEIEPENIVRSLTEHPPIMAAQVRRKLFPPGLDITLQERQPVAVTIPSRGETADNPDAAPTPNHQPGFVDAEGYWIPQTSKQELDPNFQPPSLRVRGYHSRYQSQWPSLYAALQASPVAVTEIDWRSLNNLILNTDLGLIHCGVYTPDRFPQQLTTLEKLHDLKTLQPAPKIEYIDLSNPETPALKIVPGSFPRPEADKPDG